MIKTTLGIEGMMCGMCESHINNAIRNNFKVKKLIDLISTVPIVYQESAFARLYLLLLMFFVFF